MLAILYFTLTLTSIFISSCSSKILLTGATCADIQMLNSLHKAFLLDAINILTHIHSATLPRSFNEGHPGNKSKWPQRRPCLPRDEIVVGSEANVYGQWGQDCPREQELLSNSLDTDRTARVLSYSWDQTEMCAGEKSEYKWVQGMSFTTLF